MKRKFIFISSIFILYSIHCFAQGQATNVTYFASDTLTIGAAMTALKPTSPTDKAVTYAIKPKLPDGLNLDPSTGVINGKPSGLSDADYQITASKDNTPGMPFTLKIVVRKAPCTTCSSPASAAINANCKTGTCSHPLTFGEKLLVFTPVILFVIFLTVFLIYVNSKSGEVFSLKVALSENAYPSITEANLKYEDLTKEELIKLQTATVGTTPVLTANIFFPLTITKTDNKYRPSMSRLIAFLSGMVSLAIGLCLSCFFIYSYLKTGCAPDVGALTGILAAMGIGVVPYAVNKISTMTSGGPNK